MSDKEPTSFENRRQYKRCKVSLQVGVFQHGQFNFNVAVEISQGGMLLKCPVEYRVGTCIEMCFFIPGAAFTMAVGEIAYKLDPIDGVHYAGVRFLQPSAFTQQLIASYVAQQP